MITFTTKSLWNIDDTMVILQKSSPWYRLVVFSKTDPHELRKKFRDLKPSDFIMRSALTFPNSGNILFELYWPWKSSLLADRVSNVLQGILPPPTSSETEHKMMSVKYGLAAGSPDNLVESVAGLSIYNQTSLEDSQIAVFAQIMTALEVEELCLFHCLHLSREASQLVARELTGQKILSKMQRESKSVLKGLKLGLTNPKDEQMNDGHYVHCYIGFPLVTNDYRIKRRTGQHPTTMLQMLFEDIPQTVVLPHDMRLIDDLDFKFLGKIFFVSSCKYNKTICYYEKNKDNFFRNRFADETFYGNSHTVVKGLFRILARFISCLDPGDQKVIISNRTLLKELFNELFSFRVQISFPQELTYKPYSHPNYPKTRIEELINRAEVSLPDLKQCETLFTKVYETIPSEEPKLSPEISKALSTIVSFFREPYSDGTNNYSDAFAFFGGISSQLALHFSPEISALMTPELLKAVMQINKWRHSTRSPEAENLFQRYLLIKKTNGGEISLYSLVQKSLEDLNPIQLRMPPNKRFDTDILQAEIDYLAQLTALYESGSFLITSLSQLAQVKPPMVTFNQRAHLEETLAHGLSRLASPLRKETQDFANVHNYSPEAFEGEFNRGMICYINSFEVVRDVVHANIEDFVQRLVDGSCLIEPRFKHDLLDPKHFFSGMTSSTLYPFADGEISFAQLMYRALNKIQQQERLTINGQLIIDAIHMFLKSQHPVPQITSHNDLK